MSHYIRAAINRRAIQREAIAMMIGATAIITGTMGLSLTINARAKAQPNWSLIMIADGNAYTMDHDLTADDCAGELASKRLAHGGAWSCEREGQNNG